MRNVHLSARLTSLELSISLWLRPQIHSWSSGNVIEDFMILSSVVCCEVQKWIRNLRFKANTHAKQPAFSHLPSQTSERTEICSRRRRHFTQRSKTPSRRQHLHHVCRSERPVLRQEEDRHRCRPHQAGQGFDQGQRQASFAR